MAKIRQVFINIPRHIYRAYGILPKIIFISKNLKKRRIANRKNRRDNVPGKMNRNFPGPRKRLETLIRFLDNR